MRGDYPAICQGCRILLLCSCPGWVGSLQVLPHQLPALVVGLPGLVSPAWPFCFSSFSSEGDRFSFLASPLEGFILLFDSGVSIYVVCCFLLCSSCDFLRPCPQGPHSVFQVEVPPLPLHPPACDLSLVLRSLSSSSFEPLRLSSLRNLTKKVLFLVAFATVKRIGELQAITSTVFFVQSDACLSYVSEFVAKTESFSNRFHCSFLVKSLSDFAAGLKEDLLLCRDRALRIYLQRTDSFSPHLRRLFVSP